MELLVTEKATATDSQHQSSSTPLPALLTDLPPLNTLIKVNKPDISDLAVIFDPSPKNTL